MSIQEQLQALRTRLSQGSPLPVNNSPPTPTTVSPPVFNLPPSTPTPPTSSSFSIVVFCLKYWKYILVGILLLVILIWFLKRQAVSKKNSGWMSKLTKLFGNKGDEQKISLPSVTSNPPNVTPNPPPVLSSQSSQIAVPAAPDPITNDPNFTPLGVSV